MLVDVKLVLGGGWTDGVGIWLGGGCIQIALKGRWVGKDSGWE